MREFTKSMLGYSWAVSLFGIKQLTNIIMPPAAGRPANRTRSDFDSATRATTEYLDGTFKEVYKTGDQLQRSLVDTLSDVLSSDVPNRVQNAVSDILQRFKQADRG